MSSQAAAIFRLSIFLFAALSLSCLPSAHAEPIPFSLESPGWYLSGSPLKTVPAPNSASIECLTDTTIPSITKIQIDDLQNAVWQIDTVAVWHGMKVLEMFLISQRKVWNDPDKFYPSRDLRALAMETGDELYRLINVFIQAYEGDTYFDSTYVNRSGVLCSEAQESGTGAYRRDYFWKWDSANHIPVPMSWYEKDPSDMWSFFDIRTQAYYHSPVIRLADSLIFRFAKIVAGNGMYRYNEGVPFTWSMDTIGSFKGRAVVRAVYISPHSFDTVNNTGIIVAIQTSETIYRAILVDDVPAPQNDSDCILTIGKDTLIFVNAFVGRSDTFSHNYWIWPKDCDAPVSLYQDWVLSETLRLIRPLLPDGLNAREGKGVWDFRNLSYETDTWQDPDPDDAPSGGKLKIQFGIRDARLVPTDYWFDSSDAK